MSKANADESSSPPQHENEEKPKVYKEVDLLKLLKTREQMIKYRDELDALDVEHNSLVKALTSIYMQMGAQTSKFNWTVDINETLNPTDITFFLEENQDRFFAGDPRIALHELRENLTQIKLKVAENEKRQAELHHLLKEITPPELSPHDINYAEDRLGAKKPRTQK